MLLSYRLLTVKSRFYPPPKDELTEFKSLYNPESVGHDGKRVKKLRSALNTDNGQALCRLFSPPVPPAPKHFGNRPVTQTYSLMNPLLIWFCRVSQSMALTL